LRVCFLNLLVDDVDPCGGAVAEVGPLLVPQSLGPLAGKHGRPWKREKWAIYAYLCCVFISCFVI